ncbi:MAG: hypothetical protein IPN58_09590 [Anaerolineales bacterium]|nr:hypothetical protein [Anaerolineales bacterium]
MSDKQELTRSEVARQRRAQRAVKELEQTSKLALKPVVSRTPQSVGWFETQTHGQSPSF